MARANRHFLKGLVWHLTQRCHERQFLLRFARDRRRWRHWLFEARRRYGLCVLNYAVTSNHIHLLVRDRGAGEIAAGMQLVSGRVGQEFNRRRGRGGAFWQDRYHATAVETDLHLARCMAYIDLNMVRAGAVEDPADWLDTGYRELLDRRQRYGTLDIDQLLVLFGARDVGGLLRQRAAWIQESLTRGELSRDPVWTDALAVGSEQFVTSVKHELDLAGTYREVVEGPERYELRDGP